MSTNPDTWLARPRRRFDRVGVVITIVATGIGVWFGYAGPSDSPVAPSSSTVPVDTALVTPPPAAGP